jgi:hypothetical protein
MIKSKKEKDLSKKVMYINIALNESHQTGSMMDYVSEHFDVDKGDLDRLSDIEQNKIKEWNKDIVMMGI